MINHADKIRNVLSSEMVANLALNTEMLTKAINNGFKGINDMGLEELTNTFVDMFGWEGYTKAISKIDSSSSNSVPNNTYKKYIAYADASYISQTGEGYIAYVIKTEDDKLVYRDAKKVDIRNIAVGESLAILTLLEKALELGLDDIEIYGDNKGVIDQINSRNKLRGYLPHVVNKIDKFNNVSISWRSREYNKYADMLCKLKRRGANVTKKGGKYNLKELMKLSAKVGQGA